MTGRSLTGGCLCGAVRYTAQGPVLSTAICHCDDCQRSSGSAFSVNVMVAASSFELQGPWAAYETTGTDAGLRRERRFCPRCGSPVATVMAEAESMVIIKAGTLDDREDVRPRLEVWKTSAQPWVSAWWPRPGLRRGPPTKSVAGMGTLVRRAFSRRS